MPTVVRDSFTLEREAGALPAARLLGFVRPSEEQRQAFAVVIEKLVSEGRLLEKNGVLTAG